MADLRGYVTAAGQNFEATAKQMGYPVQIGTIEIGDGVLPDSESPIARTNMVNKLKSFPAILEVDPQNPGQFIVSCAIPADDAINGAGYFIREMGCRLIGQGAGVLYAYRRVSNDFKPLITEGEAKSFIYKLRFIPSNGELLNPIIDPSIVFASVQYCDNKVANELAKLDNKQSVRAATTGPIALSGAQTIDDVVLAVGNRVLVKDQADAKQNGIYLVAAQAWTRTTDADTGAKLTSGARVYVEVGAANGTRVWYLATAGTITIGTTLLQFKDEHPAATQQLAGVSRFATQAEAIAGLLDNVAVAPKEMKATMEAMLDIVAPIGVPIPWVSATPPNSRFLLAQAQSFDKVAYPKLGVLWPTGVIPFDMRGEFPRGWDNGRSVDAGRSLLSAQGDAILNHRHNMIGMDRTSQGGNFTLPDEQYPILGRGFASNTHEYNEPSSNYGFNNSTGLIKTQFNGATDSSRLGSETRPRNIAFNYIVRAE